MLLLLYFLLRKAHKLLMGFPSSGWFSGKIKTLQVKKPAGTITIGIRGTTLITSLSFHQSLRR